MSYNLLSVTARHQAFKPGTVVRRYHNQVRLKQVREINDLRTNISGDHGSVDILMLLLQLLDKRVQSLLGRLKVSARIFRQRFSDQLVQNIWPINYVKDSQSRVEVPDQSSRVAQARSQVECGPHRSTYHRVRRLGS